jgi:hypothetical protein
LYYATVLITEIVVLYNEDSSRKRAEKEMTRRGAKAETGADKARSGGGGRLVDDDGKLQVGNIDQQMNPIFTSNGGAGGAGGAGAGAEAIAALTEPPSRDAWPLFRQEFLNTHAMLREAQQQLNMAKQKASMADDGDATGRAVKKTKKGFLPTAAPGDGANSSAASALKRAAAKRAGASSASADDAL